MGRFSTGPLIPIGTILVLSFIPISIGILVPEFYEVIWISGMGLLLFYISLVAFIWTMFRMAVK